MYFFQELKKKITAFELSNLLYSDPEFYSCVELLLGVPLLPPEFMEPGLKSVKNTVPTLIAHPSVSLLFDFISENWLPGRPNFSFVFVFKCFLSLNYILFFQKPSPLEYHFSKKQKDFYSNWNCYIANSHPRFVPQLRKMRSGHLRVNLFHHLLLICLQSCLMMI